MRITFCLPNAGHVPIGGFKVVYEYANRLSALGHDVAVVHAALARADYTLPRRLIRYARFVQRRLDGSCNPRRWFPLAKNVRSLWMPSLAERNIPDADVVIATGWETAHWIQKYGAAKGRQFHLVQHHEVWAGPERLVEQSWRYPLKKIVISRWLQDLARERGQTATYVPNGLDFDEFGLDTPVSERDPLHLAALFHLAPWKGSSYLVQALTALRKRLPQLRVTMFGVSTGEGLPPWITYVQKPNPTELRAIYNQASIFVAPSFTEGWGLTAAEAMACGAALVAADIGGHREFADHGNTALLFQPGDAEGLANAVERLINDRALRFKLAEAGSNFVRRFTWENAVQAFEGVIANPASNS